MLSQFTNNFNPKNMTNSELVLEITNITPYILNLDKEDQISFWELIGNQLSLEQQKIVTLSVSHLFTKEEQKENYSIGITYINYDIIEFKQSLETLKNIENPDSSIKSAIASMEELHELLNKKYKSNKLKN